jgi:hypothetical protein
MGQISYDRFREAHPGHSTEVGRLFRNEGKQPYPVGFVMTLSGTPGTRDGCYHTTALGQNTVGDVKVNDDGLPYKSNDVRSSSRRADMRHAEFLNSPLRDLLRFPGRCADDRCEDPAREDPARAFQVPGCPAPMSVRG